jgi:hypothetical protein
MAIKTYPPEHSYLENREHRRDEEQTPSTHGSSDPNMDSSSDLSFSMRLFP